MCKTILLDISLTDEQARIFEKMENLCFENGAAVATLDLCNMRGAQKLLTGLLHIYIKPYEKEDVSTEPCY